MAPYKIQVCGVSKCFRRDGAEVQAMRPTSLNIEEGKFISIIGPSGCVWRYAVYRAHRRWPRPCR